MYFEIDEYRPDITPVGRAISWREGVLLSIIFHLVMVIVILLFPRFFPFDQQSRAGSRRASAAADAKTPPVSCSCSRATTWPRRNRRRAPSLPTRIGWRSAPERAPNPDEPAAVLARQFAGACRSTTAAGAGAGRRARRPTRRRGRKRGTTAKIPETLIGAAIHGASPGAARADGRQRRAVRLGDALRNLQRYVPREQFDNPGGNGGSFGPEIQFDTKGVEFGPWIRRFIAQVKRNWFVPYAAMSMRGTRRHHVQRAQGRLDHRPHRRRAESHRRVQQRRVRRAVGLESDAAAAAGVPVGEGVLHGDVLLQRDAAAETVGHDALAATRPRDPAVRRSSPTCSSASGDPSTRRRGARADGHREERAGARRSPRGSAARSSTAIRRPSIAGSTSAPTRCRRTSGAAFRITSSTSPIRPTSTRRRDYARDAAAAIRDIIGAGTAADCGGRHRLLLPRADARAVSGPRARRRACARGSTASPRGAASSGCIGCCGASIPRRRRGFSPATRSESCGRSKSFLLTGRPLTEHFADTQSPLADVRRARHRPEAAGRPSVRARDAARGRTVRAGSARRDAGAAGARSAGRLRGRSAGWSTGRRSSTCTACATRRRRAR